jgi:tetratricopeptide (TPR) repeat protein
MQHVDLLEKVQRVERELGQLKADLQPVHPQNHFIRGCRELMRFLVNNWVLVTLLSAVATAVYVKFAFDVDFFEDYRSMEINRDLSEFYRELGDQLMESTYYGAAAEAFRTALVINPNNTEATYGLVKAEVFEPLEGQEYPESGVVNIRLNYLLNRFPNDYQVHLLRGYQYSNQRDAENAEFAFLRSIELNPDVAAGYVALGTLHQQNLDSDETIERSMTYYEQAIELEPDHAVAHNNLGYMHILLGNFEAARVHLEDAIELSPSYDTALILGDTYRYLGDFESALFMHRTLMSNITGDPELADDETFMGTLLFYNYMPTHADDRQSIRYYVEISSLQQKRVFLHYALSFDYALTGNLEAANEEFEAAYHLDSMGDYRMYFAYTIVSLENFLPLNQEALAWFDRQYDRLLL